MCTTREQGSLYTKIENRIATIEFGHPASNSFPKVLLDRLSEEFDILSENDEVSVIILKSEGEKAFCGGASLKELALISNEQQGKIFFSGFANVINSMRKCSKLIIGRVQGKAVGGGVGLISACDYVLATENASIKLSEFTIGIGPFVISPAVERKIGVNALADLTLDATNWKTAYWAKEKGMYARVLTNIEDLDVYVNSLAEKLVSYNPEALKEMKKVLWRGTENWDELLIEYAGISGKLVMSDNTKKALEKL